MAKKIKSKKRAPKRPRAATAESAYQRTVKRLMAGPVGKEIQREFHDAKEVVYALRVASGYLADDVRRATGDEKFGLHDWAVPWAVAVNNRLDREGGATRTTVKCAFIPALAKAGMLTVVRRLGGGICEIDLAPCAARIQPLLDQAVREAPAKVAEVVAKQEERNKKIRDVIERQEREGLAAGARDGSEVNAAMVSEAKHMEALRAALRIRPVDMGRRVRQVELDEMAKKGGAA